MRACGFGLAATDITPTLTTEIRSFNEYLKFAKCYLSLEISKFLITLEGTEISIITNKTETPDIYEDLKAKLVSGALTPGMKLKPTALQGEYDCAPNTVRDVLMRLSNIGLVEFQMQRGFRATTSTLDRRSDIARFRILLEQAGAADSMKRGGLGWEADLTATHHKLLHIERQIVGKGDIQNLMPFWTDAERVFHETLISACGSPMLIETFAKVYLQFRQQFVGQQRDFGANYFEAIIAEHQAIVDAALSRDEAACQTAIYNHLKRNLHTDDLAEAPSAS